MAISKDEFIQKYTKAIREGNAAVFAGAGLSRPSGFVNWKDLLRPLAKTIGLDVERESDLLSVAQYYRNKRGNRSAINQLIIDAFTQGINYNKNIDILTRLPIFTYWTTNYDELIENGIQNANRNPEVKTESEHLPLMKPDRDAIVYKMHGEVKNPAHAVLTKADYEMYERTRPLFRTALKGDLVSKVFLFIGFSFEDPNLNYILSQIHSLLGENVPEHYCIFKRISSSDYPQEADYGYAKAKQELQEEDLRLYGIQTVFVDSYSEITEILQEIEKYSKTKNVFISGSIGRVSGIWTTEKAEELASRLASSLVHSGYRITSGFGLGLGSAVINGALDTIYSEKYKHIGEHLSLRPFPQITQNEEAKKERWKKYREDMLEETGISIFMFGNKIDKENGTVVEADGCIQEFEIAREKGNAIIPIGSTGFAAKTILERVKADIDKYPYLCPYVTRLESETEINSIIETVMAVVAALS